MRLRMRDGLPSADLRYTSLALRVSHIMPHSCICIWLDVGMIVYILLVY